MARDPDTIQREIERSRDALAASLDVLSARVNPKKLADDGRQAAAAKLADPKIKYALYARRRAGRRRGGAQHLPLTRTRAPCHGRGGTARCELN